MEIVKEEEGEALLYKLNGDLDVYSTGEVESALLEGLEEGRTIVVDLSEVPFADSSGLGGLIGVYKKARARGIEIRLRNPKPIVSEILTITHMKKFFPVEES